MPAKLALVAVVAIFSVIPASAQDTRVLTPQELFQRNVGTREQQENQFPPHKVIGNIYYVGTETLAAFLVTTPQGHILVNTMYERTVPVIQKSVEQLGFKFTDIKIVLGSHAHADHMEGDALVKQLTGAQVMAMEQDVAALQAIQPGGKAHPIDKVLHDGDQVTLGSTMLVAHLTPGHTKGCTTWTMKLNENGKPYNVVIVGSPNVNPGYKLVGNALYPRIAEDYERMFRVLTALPVDYFLGAHGSYFGMEAKFARMKEGGPSPFIDPDGYKAFVAQKEKDFRTELAKQRAAAVP